MYRHIYIYIYIYIYLYIYIYIYMQKARETFLVVDEKKKTVVLY